MTWFYKDHEFTSDDIGDYLGFVYLITNLSSGRKYIGKKLFKSRRTRTINGKKKRELVESDWKDYWSSSPVLHRDLEELGKENFKREILWLLKNKGNLNYMEMYEQSTRQVLEKQDEYYNGIINCKINASHLKLDSLRQN